MHAAYTQPDPNMSGSDRELWRRFNRDPEPPNEGHSSSPFPPSLPPLRSLQHINMSSSPRDQLRDARDRSVAASRRFRERRRRLYLDGASPGASYEDTGRNEYPNSDLRTLLGTHTNLPPLAPPTLSPPLQTQDLPDEGRRSKRRKLDSDKVTSNFRGFRYGRYGQVEPGQLTMEIVSCDGGLFLDGALHAAENILINDSSVYCTKSNRCNIVLRHQGATVFSLKELIIKAPGSEYTCP